MIACVFSFQTLEAYDNATISARANAPSMITRCNTEVQLSPAVIERRCSTDEKLGLILPALLHVKSPKRRDVWSKYKELKNARDSTVHLKSEDHYVRGRPDKDSIYYRLLLRSPVTFPAAAIATIRYFCADQPERWLGPAEARLTTIESE
jgi:hypothetical protein